MKEEVEEEKEWMVLSEMNNFYSYNRSQSKYTIKLSLKLKTLYNVNHCFISPSGMCAINTVFHSILRNKKYNVVYSSELYSDTPKCITKHLQKLYNINTFAIDVTSTDSIKKLFKEDLKDSNNILFIESCSNPNSLVMDLSIIEELRKLSKSFVFIVDNTWLSSVSYNPFDNNADIVVNSLTKYYSGGMAIGGAILCKNEDFVCDIIDWISFNGLHVSPYNAKIILNSLDGLESRIKKSSENTLKIIENIKGNKNIDIIHPSLKSHPSYKLFKKYMKYHPSVFTIKVKSSKRKVLNALKNSKYIEHKTSFGSDKSRTNGWPDIDNEFVIFRISIGYDDDFDKTMKGIDEILKNIFL
jgi:cystathionine beta-lyase/cystathionine gamma-synthase